MTHRKWRSNMGLAIAMATLVSFLPLTGAVASADTGKLLAPKSVIAVGGSHQADISWEPPAITSNASSLPYTVSSQPTAKAPASCVATTALHCVFTGLTDGVAYRFSVSSGVGDNFTSLLSNPVTPQSPPSQPRNVRVEARPDKVLLSWQRPSFDGGASTLRYLVVANPSAPTPTDCEGIQVTHCSFTGLRNGIRYTFSVTASNGVGQSTHAARSRLATPASPPSAPTLVTATAGNAQATVSWHASTTTGGVPIAGYSVSSTPAVAAPASCTMTKLLTCTFTGLTNGTAYTFKVNASNGVAVSAWSSLSGAVTPVAPPNPAIGVILTPGNSQIKVNWTGLVATKAAPISQYVATATPGGATCTYTPPTSGMWTDTCTITNLTNGQNYSVSVVAVGAGGRASASSPMSATPIGPSSAPRSVMAAPGNQTATISWLPPLTTGGSAITSYQVTASPGGFSCTYAVPLVGPETDTCIVRTLANGTRYTFSVTATNGVGISVAGTSSGVVPVGLPGVPTAVKAVGGITQATVSWTAPAITAGAPLSSYRVTANPGGGTCSYSVPATGTPSNSCIVTGLSGGQSYTFSVVSIGPAGTSASSISSSATLVTGPPSPPGGVSAQASPGAALVSWLAPTNVGGSAITSYTVTSSPGSKTCTYTVPKTGVTNSCTVTGLTNGTSYTFTVVATNQIGSHSVASAPSSPVTPYAIPAAPSNVVATSLTWTSMTVTWTLPPSNVVAPISSFVVTATPGNATCTAQMPTSGTTAGCVVGSLSSTGSYTFKVVSVGPGGTSVASAPSAAGAPKARPGMPTSVVAVAGVNQATVTWQPPASGAGPVTSYSVIASPPTTVPAACTMTTQLLCTFTGLSGGTSYTFTVVANGPGGASLASSPSNAVVAMSLPTAPRFAQVTANPNSLIIQWTAPTSTGGLPLYGYTVTAMPGNEVCTAVDDGSGSASCVISGLSEGTNYTLSVVATNLIGDSSSVTLHATPANAPGAPVSASALASSHSAQISWLPSTSDGGATITKYTATASPSGKACTYFVDATNAMTCVISGLDNGTNYTFDVTATNGAGKSDATTTNSVMPLAPPGNPTSVSATATDSSVSVFWAAPQDSGGLDISSYTATLSPGGQSCTWNVDGTDAYSCSISGLSNGTSYTATVVATTPFASSSASSPSNAVIPAGITTAPTSVTASAQDSQATVSWQAPASNNGSVITSYTVTSSPDGLTCADPSSPGGTPVDSCTVKGLTNGTSYTFSVTATNGAGTSSASSPSNAVIPAGITTAPTSVTASAQDSQATVSWQAPASNNGSVITSYTVTSSPDGLTCADPSSPGGTPVDSCTVKGLTNGTSYTFSVTATNGAGTSSASSPSNAVIPAGLPQTPVGLIASAGDRSVALAWQAPSANGSPITRYDVTTWQGGNALGAVQHCANTTCTISNLTNGTAYQFSVTAVNAVGSSVATALSAAVIPARLPSSPSSVVGVAANTAIAVSWAAVDAGGLPLIGYSATAMAADGSSSSCSASATSTSCVITGLRNATAYSVVVSATNAIGSMNSLAVSTTPTTSANCTYVGIDANLQGCNLTNDMFATLDLSGANLTGANLTGTNLQGANLTGANFTGTNLTLTTLTQAILTGDDLSSATLVDITSGSITDSAAYMDTGKWLPRRTRFQSRRCRSLWRFAERCEPSRCHLVGCGSWQCNAEWAAERIYSRHTVIAAHWLVSRFWLSCRPRSKSFRR